MEPVRRRATYDDLLQLPENMIGEILDGELIASPRPASPHAFASSGIGIDIGFAFRGRGSGSGPGGWWILDEPELHLGPDVLVPDLAGWRIERMPQVPNVAAFTLAPDWVCEVVSPSTVRIDRVQKMQIYAREQVPHLWLVDPLAQTLEVYHLDGQRWMVQATHSGAARVRAEPFAAIELELDRWWLPG
ncbi:MAG TPA: Uma2 family endonuclease [Terriglobales bacterium]|nr:Uma2 family endonuclease [Terriglobales bacterium]